MSARRLVLIVNPCAGPGRALDVARRAEGELGGNFEVELVRTERPGHARELAAGLELAGCAGVCAVGGDGTLHELVNGLMTRADGSLPVVGVVPAGSGNSVARDLACESPAAAVRHIAAGASVAIDLARVDVDGASMHSVNVVGFGAFARINRRAERMRWAVGHRYNLAAVAELAQPRVHDGGFRLDGDGAGTSWLLGAACITQTTGAGMRIAPRARIADGLLDLVLIRRTGRLRLLALLSKVGRGAHAGSPAVEMRQVRRVGLDLDPGSHVVVDGESYPARRVVMNVLPRALRVFGATR